MDVDIFTRNLELTDRLASYVEEKVQKLDRYLSTIEDVRVDLSETKVKDASRRMVAQITLHVPRSILRAEERAGDIFTAFDAAMDKIERQIKRYKGRRLDRRKAGAAVAGPMPPVPAEEETTEAATGRIVRTKRFEVSSITPEEAAEQMELLGHSFFIFLDVTDGQLSILYKRHDGNYGLIKPIY